MDLDTRNPATKLTCHRRRRWRGIMPLLTAAVIGGCLFVPAGPSAGGKEPNRDRSRAPIWDESHHFQVYVKNARELRNQNVVMQQRDFSCGAAALATIVNYYWKEDVGETAILVAIAVTLSREELQDRIKNGLTLADLQRVSSKFGYQAVLGRLSVEKLSETKIPLLVGITVNGYEHFVVVRGADDRYVYIADPTMGNVRTPIAEFERQWQKNLALVVIKRGGSPQLDSPLAVRKEERDWDVPNRSYLRNNVTGRF